MLETEKHQIVSEIQTEGENNRLRPFSQQANTACE